MADARCVRAAIQFPAPVLRLILGMWVDGEMATFGRYALGNHWSCWSFSLLPCSDATTGLFDPRSLIDGVDLSTKEAGWWRDFL